MTFHQLLPVTLLINLINQYIVMYYYKRIIREELFDVSLEIFMLPSRYIVLKSVGLHNEYFTADAFVLLLECMIATCDTTIYCNIATFA